MTFEAERFLGKQIIKNRNDESAQQSRLDKPPVVTENPYADEFNDMSTEGAFDFFSKLGNEESPKKEPKEEEKRVESPSQVEIQAHHDPKDLVHDTISRNANWNEGHESLIKKNLLIGNL